MLGSRRAGYWAVVIITVVVTAVFGLSAWWSGEIDRGNIPVDILLILANGLPILAVRWNPILVALAIGIAFPLWVGGFVSIDREGHLLQSLPAVVAMYAAGSWDRSLRVRAIALVTPAWMMLAAVSGRWPVDPLELSYVAVVLVVVWALGVTVAGRRSYAARLEAKTVELQNAQRELAERAVADERSRIARELHDVVAHAMSVITVQAGVGAHVAESQPRRAATALSAIERTGREAMEEMRRMLAILHENSPGETPARRQAGLDDLATLVEKAVDAGVMVTVEVAGHRRSLPAGLDLAAYRVVQEALTNVAKHAPGSRAHVQLEFQGDRLRITVRDHGGPVREPIVAGQGLRGMAERAALYDGTLEAEPEADGFRVMVQFPIDPGEAPGAGLSGGEQ